MKNNINWNFDNTYSKLPEPFREKINPVKVKNPKLARAVGPVSPLATGGDAMQSSRNLATLAKKAGIGSKKGKRG